MKQTNDILTREPDAETLKYFNTKVLRSKAYTPEYAASLLAQDPTGELAQADLMKYAAPLSTAALQTKMAWFTQHLQAMLLCNPWDRTGSDKVLNELLGLLAIAPQVKLEDRGHTMQATFNVYRFARHFWRKWNMGTDENQQLVLLANGDITQKQFNAHAAEKAAEKAAKEQARAEKKAETEAKKAEKKAAAPKAKTKKAEAGWACPKCGHENIPEQFGFCPFCGEKKPEPVATVWTCANGHDGIPTMFNFCPTCGAKKPELEKQVVKPAATPKAEAPKAEAPKAERKSTRRNKKTEAAPAAPAEAPVVVDTRSIGQTMGTVDLEDEKKPSLLDTYFESWKEIATPEQMANLQQLFELNISAVFTENANRVNAQATPSADTLARKSH